LLRRHNRYPGKFALEIRYADGKTMKSRRPLPPIANHLDYQLFRIILPTFKQLTQRRVAVRRMMLELYEFSMPIRQMSLFPWEETSLRGAQKLQKALDDIRQRFGRQAITWGKTQLLF